MMARRVRRIVVGAVVALLAAGGLVGCQEEQLKEEIVSLKTRLRLAEAEKADLQQDKAELAAQNAQLQTHLAQTQTELAQKPREVIVEKPVPMRPDFGPGIEVTEDERGVTVTLPNTILFDSGKATLKSSSLSTLDRIVSVIRRDYPGREIRVEGHTDNVPIKKSGWKDNWELSCQRSLAVLRHLTERGIPEEGIYAAGFGEYAPRDTNASAAGRSRNRRVEIVITR